MDIKNKHAFIYRSLNYYEKCTLNLKDFFWEKETLLSVFSFNTSKETGNASTFRTKTIIFYFESTRKHFYFTVSSINCYLIIIDVKNITISIFQAVFIIKKYIICEHVLFKSEMNMLFDCQSTFQQQ